MRQILQNLRSGETVLAELPAPSAERGHLLIRTRVTLVSQGTEKMLVQFGKASLWGKARSQPEKVRQVVQKIMTDGLVPTIEAVFRKLDEPLPLGYCNAGVVIGVGAGVTGFAVGDRVASNGAHAEVVSVPVNLCAKIPAGVTDEEAAFTVAGAIALQGVRLAGPTLGETVAVVGLGLLGQLAVQLLRANGCRVLGYDFDAAKVEMARRFGVDALCVAGEGDPVRHALASTNGLGVDAVLITASASSNEVVAQSARMSRKRGRIVLVGVVGLELNRADFYEKELSFQVSCSYGPGRYEDAYEEKGLDYPAAFVRWTENRNFQAVLAAMASGGLDVKPLISRRVPLEQFGEIYDDLGAAGLASLLTYGAETEKAESGKRTAYRRCHAAEGGKLKPAGGNLHGNGAPVSIPSSTIRINDRRFGAADGAIAVIGAGNFTKMTLMPALKAARAPVAYIASASGVSSTHLARKYGVPASTTDLGTILADDSVRGVIITTRHHQHAAQTIAALKAGKHVLVEKPLCLSLDELRAIEAVISAPSIGNRDDPNNQSPIATHPPTVTVGFNRRFSPHSQKIRSLLGPQPGPLSLVATMNAGPIPLKHWVHDPEAGGGRLVGEACHFVDLAVFVTGSLVAEVCATGLGGGGAPAGDTASMLLRHANGSTSVVNYFANGHRSHPKEKMEIFSQERVLVLDDFRVTTGVGFRGFSRLKTGQDKGHAAQFAEFARRVREGGAPLIPWEEVANVTRATLAIGESLRTHAWVRIGKGE
jgi:predicted dehydrogenase/threonine dehydrogenase-like Zn-dependent dehydrogenase